MRHRDWPDIRRQDVGPESVRSSSAAVTWCGMLNDAGLCAACWCQSRPRVTQLASQYAGAIPLRAHRSTMWPIPRTCGPSCRRAYETCWIRRGPGCVQTSPREGVRARDHAHRGRRALARLAPRCIGALPGRAPATSARGLGSPRWLLHAGAVVDDYFEVFDFGSGCVCCR